MSRNYKFQVLVVLMILIITGCDSAVTNWVDGSSGRSRPTSRSLETPAAITATSTTNSITLTWPAISGAATYRILRGLSPSSLSTLDTATTNTYVDTTSLVFGTTYYYAVQAIDKNTKTSSISDTISAALSPLTVTLSSTAPAQISVGGEILVKVVFSEAVNDFVLGDITATGATPSLLTGSGTTYYFSVTPAADTTIRVLATKATSAASGVANQASNVLTYLADSGAALTVGFVTDSSSEIETNSVVPKLIPLVMSGTKTYDVVVNYKLISSETNFLNPSNFDLASTGTVTIPAGATTANLSFNFYGDTLNLGSKKMKIALVSTNSQKVAVLEAVHQKFIKEDDNGYTTFKKISISDVSTCAITSGDVLKCWGGIVGNGTSTYSMTPVVVDSGTTYSEVSCGHSYVCAITTAGVLKCFGYNPQGQLGDGTTTNRFSPTVIDSGIAYAQIHTGYYHTCGLTTAGLVRCWGLSNAGIGDGSTNQYLSPISVDAGTVYVKLTTSGYTASNLGHNCGITNTGVLKCWGDNSVNQLGDGTTTDRLTPGTTDGGTTYSEIVAGYMRTCGITTAGVLKCWGSNLNGQVGNGTVTTSVATPTVIDSGVNYSKISGSFWVTCGVTTGGVLKCWGHNSYGQLGIGTSSTNSPSPSVMNSGVSYSIPAGGYYNSCALTTTGVLHCWGSQGSILGVGTTTLNVVDKNQIVPVDPGSTYKAVSSSVDNFCAIQTNGALNCWGVNANGEIGTGTTTSVDYPVVVDPGVTYAKVTRAAFSTCGVTDVGVLKCWGDNAYGQVGDGTGVDKLTPTVVDTGVSYSSVSGKNIHLCGLTSAGAVKCWGSNFYGQVGDASTTQRNSPVAVDVGTAYSKVVTGEFHTCGITAAGVLKCWGYNGFGELGNGNTTDSTTPIVSDSGTLYSEVALGESFTCGVTVAGVLKCWGYNAYYELGNGTTTNSLTPVVIDSGTSYTKLSADKSHSCGLTTAGELKCWGNSMWGGIRGTTPTVIDAGVSFIAVATGNTDSMPKMPHTCAITSDGILKCKASKYVGTGLKSMWKVPLAFDY